MEQVNLDITTLDKDVYVNIEDKLQYSTLGDGELEGLQCNFPEHSWEYEHLIEILRNIHKEIIEINEIIKRERFYESNN